MLKEILAPDENKYFSKPHVYKIAHYPKAYLPSTTAMQYEILHEIYPDLDGSHIPEITKDLGRLRQREELYQIAPKLSAVAYLSEIEEPYTLGYGQCLKIMVDHMQTVWPGFSANESLVCNKNRRMLAETKAYLKELEEETPGDYIIFPMQSGRRFAGYSIEEAQIEVEKFGHWALPTWIVGHHLITNPQRFPIKGSLVCDNLGDEMQGVKYLERYLCFTFCQLPSLITCGNPNCRKSNHGSLSGFHRSR